MARPGRIALPRPAGEILEIHFTIPLYSAAAAQPGTEPNAVRGARRNGSVKGNGSASTRLISLGLGQWLLVRWAISLSTELLC